MKIFCLASVNFLSCLATKYNEFDLALQGMGGVSGLSARLTTVTRILHQKLARLITEIPWPRNFARLNYELCG